MVYTRFELKDGKVVMRIQEADDCTTCPEECFCGVISHEGEVPDDWGGETGEWYPTAPPEIIELKDDWWEALYEMGGEA